MVHVARFGRYFKDTKLNQIYLVDHPVVLDWSCVYQSNSYIFTLLQPKKKKLPGWIPGQTDMESTSESESSGDES